MPIRPENAKLYPPNWRTEIRPSILERAGNRCEGSPAFPDCRAPNHWWRNNSTGELTDDPMLVESWAFVDRQGVTYIVLTIAHLDHNPENCDPANLRAWCQRCHLNYDAKLHAQNSYATRRRGRALADIFDDTQ